MPRDAAGVFSLVAGVNPVTPSTVIATAWANPTLSDIGDELTNSLDRAGRGAMTATLKVVDGTFGGNLGLAFASDLDNGAIREAANDWSLIVGGLRGLRLRSTMLRSDLNLGIGVDPVSHAASSRLIHIDGGANPAELRFTNNASGSAAGNGANATINNALEFYIWNLENAKFSFGTNNNERLVISADGHLYGKALHNNGVAPVGSSNQYIASGTYTPTITNSTNVAASTSALLTWSRVGNMFFASGVIQIDPTAATTTVFKLTLPPCCNTNFATITQATGHCSARETANLPTAGSIYALTGTQTVECIYVATSTANNPVDVFFAGLIL